MAFRIDAVRAEVDGIDAVRFEVDGNDEFGAGIGIPSANRTIRFQLSVRELLDWNNARLLANARNAPVNDFFG